jgi:hypothetical protein
LFEHNDKHGGQHTQHSEHAVPPPKVWRHVIQQTGGAEAAVEAAAAEAEAESEAAEA